jgi:hypothetical protein
MTQAGTKCIDSDDCTAEVKFNLLYLVLMAVIFSLAYFYWVTEPRKN